MKATDVQTEIQAAAATLGLSSEQFRQLPDPEAEHIYRTALSRFVTSRFEPRWWWEHLRDPDAGFQPEGIHAFDVIPKLVPDADAPVYLVAEDDPVPFYPVYRTTVRTAMAVLSECFGFEYYLISPDFSWLVGENHHDVVFGTGEPIVQAINAYINATGNA
jgi:hypothetical protein